MADANFEHDVVTQSTAEKRRAPSVRRPGFSLSVILNSVAAWVVGGIFTFPLVWAFFTALKPSNEVFSPDVQLIGSRVLWSNYVDAWNEIGFGRLLFNSLSIALISTTLTLVISTLTAYAFSRLAFRGRNALFVLFVITLTLPAEIAVIPLFFGFNSVGLVDTWVALIIPGVFGAFGAFLLRQFMLQIPVELEEAARMDGAGVVGILFRIIIPLVRPALAVLGIFAFLGSWNAYLWPLIILNTRDRWTIPLGLGGFSTMTGTQWELLAAASVLTILPVVIVVVLGQRQLVAAIGAGAFGGR